MKRKFIFLVMLFALLGGVNQNVLNAQDVVTIGGEATSTSGYYPIAFGVNYQLSQHVYTADEIGHAAGTIEKIAFKVNVTQTRNLTFYLKNTTTESLINWESYTDADMVFHSDAISTAPTDGWVTFELDTPFEYTGGNILLTAADNTGSYSSTNYGNGNYFRTLSRNATFYVNGTNPVSASGGYYSTRQPSIRFTFGEAQDDLEPAVPTNLVATAVNHNSISLTWDEAENAKSYNVYQNGTSIGFASTTSYLVEGLNANTEYCFTVTGVRGQKESADSEQACATTAKAPLVKEVLVGAGDVDASYIPTYTYYNYSTTQQIYTADELGFGAGNVSKIAFYNNGSAVSRNIDVYITNTTKDSFTGGYDMVNMTAEDKVYSGTYTFVNGWCEIAFSKNFEYTGGNILICVDDNTGSYVPAPTFKGNNTANCRANYRYEDSSNNNYDPLNVAGKYTLALNQNNQIKFFVEAEPGVKANVEAIEFAEVKLGNYWSEKYNAPSAEVKVENIGAEITSIESSNEFFVLSENIDLTASTVIFNVTCKTDTQYAGSPSGNIVISYEIEGEASTIEIPVTATAYAPERPDVIELATNVTFTEGTYTNTPDFATLHDDYILPGEATEGSTPDAVYHFTMENEGTLTVNVTGTNAVAAVYKAGDIDLENEIGPSSNNNYEGEVAEVAPVEMDIVIGEENSISNGYLPSNEYYNYSVSQQIYTASEINASKGIIKSIAFRQRGAASGTRNLAVYMLNTDETAFADNRSWVALSSENLVFSGNVTYPAVDAEWCQIDLQTPFEYNGTNILLCVVDNTGTFSSDITFDTYETTEQRAIYVYNDNASYNVANLSVYSGNITVDYKNVVNTVKFHGEFVANAKSMAKSRSTEPQINAVQYPAGEYYLVAAAEDAFTVSIETGSLPAPGEFAYTAPADGATEQNNPKLTWEAAQYATKYQVFLGTESTETELELVAEVETPSYQTEGLLNNTQYFWRVDAVNAIGTTKGMVYSFVTPLDVPQNLVATNIYEGETTTLTWDAIENAKYNVYVDGEKVSAEPITATSYELTGLAYNTSGYNVTVTAVHTLGESPKSAAVNVKVAGKFTLVLNVKNADEEAIAGATVTFNTESFYNEFYELVPAIEAMTTNDDGMISIELPLPCVYGAPLYTYSSLGAIVTKESYGTKGYWIYSGSVTNGEVITGEVVLELAKPAYLEADSYQLLAGDTLVMAWDAVTGAIGYNIYKGVLNEETYSYDYDKLNEEIISDTTYTINGVEYGMNVQYAVTAVYAELGESDYTTTTIDVTGMGEVLGTVTDGTNPVKGVKGVKVVLTGMDEFGFEQTYNFTTDAEGKFYGEVMVGYDYTARATRYDYEDAEQTEIKVEYGGTTECTIVMTSYPSATIAVTATESGNNAIVSWEAEYEKYNVYRRNAETDAIKKLASNVTLNEYQDTEWASLENGTYQYGVSAAVGSQDIDAFNEDFQSSGWNMPEGWENIPGYYSSYWAQYWSANNGDTYFYAPASYMTANLNTPIIDLSNSTAATLSFDYMNTPYGYGYDGTNTLYIKVKADGESNWTLIDNGTISGNVQSFTKCELQLDNYIGKKIQISFEVYTQAYAKTTIDNVVITSSTPRESIITWSNELVKKSALTFNNEAKDNDWSNVDNWDGGVLPTANDNVIVAAEANINGVVAVNNLTISEDAKLNVNKSGTLTVNGTITDLNQYGSLYFEDGAQIFQNNEGVNAYFRMNIQNPKAWDESIMNCWQFISSPLLGADITSAATKYDNDYQPSDYDLYKYNGAAELEWVNHKSGNFETTFEQGRGYMYSHQARTIVTLGGTLNPARTHEYEVSYTEGEGNELANLHLLGNPFTFNMDWAEVNVTNVYDGFATLNEAGDDYVYATEGTINVGDGFFVQATGSDPAISYEKTRGSKETAANINVIARGIAGEDNVIINFAGEGEGFSKLQGFNKDKATVFVANNGRRYGIANVDENATEVELSFVASQMGNYSISLDVNGEFETVTLVDRFTGIETNMLLEDEYNFTATSRDNANRFVVKLDNRQQTTVSLYIKVVKSSSSALKVQYKSSIC